MIFLLACVATVPALPGDLDSGVTDSEDTNDTQDSADTGDGPVYDCDDPPDFNLGDDVLDQARGYHGLVFDDDGHLIGWDATKGAMIKATYDGDSETFVPGIPGVEQMTRRNSTGDIFFVDITKAALFRMTPEGGHERVTGGFYSPYGVALGPDGMIYVSDGNVVRVDPETGDKETIVEMPDGGNAWMAHAIDWNLDSTMMYIATVPYGDLLQVELDEDLNPIGEPERLVRLPGHWLDAVRVDACVDMWVAEFGMLSLYRIDERGEWDEMVDGGQSRTYGHGITWGNGVGGWRTDAIYQPLPYRNSEVLEVIIGVPDGRTVRTWKGQPVTR